MSQRRSAEAGAAGTCKHPSLRHAEVFEVSLPGCCRHASQKVAPEAMFVDRVMPVRFALFDTQQHFHVPMLCTPWSCATYRGS